MDLCVQITWLKNIFFFFPSSYSSISYFPDSTSHFFFFKILIHFLVTAILSPAYGSLPLLFLFFHWLYSFPSSPVFSTCSPPPPPEWHESLSDSAQHVCLMGENVAHSCSHVSIAHPYIRCGCILCGRLPDTLRAFWKPYWSWDTYFIALLNFVLTLLYLKTVNGRFLKSMLFVFLSGSVGGGGCDKSEFDELSRQRSERLLSVIEAL
jgi:hypothetical protein